MIRKYYNIQEVQADHLQKATDWWQTLISDTWCQKTWNDNFIVVRKDIIIK